MNRNVTIQHKRLIHHVCDRNDAANFNLNTKFKKKQKLVLVQCMMSIYLYHHYNAFNTLFVINIFYVSGQDIHTRNEFNLK